MEDCCILITETNDNTTFETMTISEKAHSSKELNSVIEMLVNDVMNGVTLKTVRKSLENKNLPSELVTKLTRIVEISAKQMGA